METPITFECEGSELIGILTLPDTPPKKGIVFVVADGPQYRAGVQRQFVTLSRAMAAAGYAALRFDYRGMGDSEGTHRGFEHVDADIKAAIDALLKHCASVEEIVLWGECDSTAAVLFYAYQDPRITGISIANPWVRTEEGRAKTIVKHYYLQRLLDKAFWKKLLSGQFQFGSSLASLWRNIKNAMQSGKHPADSSTTANTTDASGTAPESNTPKLPPAPDRSQPLPARLAFGLNSFQGKVLLILSGNDWIATEFKEVVDASPQWQALLQDDRLVQHEIDGADHSFSKKDHRIEMIRLNLDWLKTW